MKQVIYVTGNPEKAANFSRHMGQDIEHHAVKLDEIQTLDPVELIEHKTRQAFEQLKKPVLIEDVTLAFSAWQGLPGPFVKFFANEGSDKGLENLCRMLDGFEDRSALAASTFGYYDGIDLKLFSGEIHGYIADRPRSSGGFGFDKIFVPDGFNDRTAAELNEHEYDRYYTTIKPFSTIRAFLEDE